MDSAHPDRESEQPKVATSFYKRSNFVTHLPVDWLYSPSHFWLAPEEGNRWRIGFTKFATRMLGELVDHQWEKTAGTKVSPGEIIGSIEGFKAISDLYCAAEGLFLEGNPALAEKIELVSKDPYGAGWLYRVEGTPDTRCMSLEAYRALLDTTIDRILEKQQHEEP
jgi:glycine cleavage system H protein